MADSRTGAGNTQDESEQSCRGRTKRKHMLKKKNHTTIGVCPKDIGTNRLNKLIENRQIQIIYVNTPP